MKAVVGGGASGLGFAIAEKLAAEGHDLLLWGRDQQRLRRAADKIHGVTVDTVVADASDPGAAQRIAEAADDWKAGRFAAVPGESDSIALPDNAPSVVNYP